MGSGTLTDLLGRPLRNLRLSVTDRCNLRCSYCMPEAEYVWLPRQDILHFEEMSALVDVFALAGVDRVRLTGGEPLLRRDLPDLIRMLAAKPAIRDLAMTTNGVMLAESAGALKEAGLHRLTVSLDTLQRDRFRALTRFDSLDVVLHGIDEASGHFPGLKLDSVIMRGTNDDEIVALLDYARGIDAEVRFIEYMDVGGATQWSPERVDVAAGDARIDRAAVRPGHAARGNYERARRSLSTARRNDLRDHLVDDRSVLPKLRSQQADGRRHVVPLSVRHNGHRSPNAAAARRFSGRAAPVDYDGVGGARPIAARKSGWRSAIARRSCRRQV